MSIFLHELERLSRTESAVVRITIDRGVTAASWKKRGKRREVVRDLFGDHISNGARYPASSVDSILHTLLERLGMFHDVPTTEQSIKSMTPRQRERCRELMMEIRAIQRDALSQVGDLEPALASPRSSLHPAGLLGDRE